MPEPDPRTPLDVQLARGRTDLLDRIGQPPLDRIQHRAARRRRRRRNAAGGALLALAVAGTLLIRPWAGVVDPAPPPVAGTPPAGPIYTAAGITINGLTETGLTDIAGTISDVEFTDPDHGYLVAECASTTPCPASVARTSDGGVSWQPTELPGATRGQTGLDLIAFPGGRLVVIGDTAYTSTDNGYTWRPGTGTSVDTSGRVLARPDDRLRLQPAAAGGAGGCGGTIQVWQSAQLADGGSVSPGRISVCWVAPEATADGAWWIGGTQDGQAVAAVTRDGGTTWTQAPLDAPAGEVGSVQVAVLGRHAYAAVLGPDGTIRALFRSTDGGRTFSRTSTGTPVGGPGRLAGSLVPLLDGRLLVAGTDNRWYVSADDGHSFTRANGTLPAVGRLARTASGYVAYNLFGGGWAAYSGDGSTWRKLQIN
jgi:hypothetical protein